MSSERYEIIDKIGQGGVGAVYKALDTQLNREVAMKRVIADQEADNGEEATKSLLKEAASLSALQHPHIVTVYDSGIDDDGPYVVMELIKGRTLDEMVERGTLTWDDLYEVALQTQEALIAAQDLNLVHRDLKPGNVMVCWLASGKFQVKIVDFGLAKFSATPSLQTIDHGDAVFGSIFFMAPEQFERTPLDQRTDMYAMGALYYYALTGEYPFNGDTAAAVMASHLQHHVTHLSEVRPDIPTWAANWIMWHMERDMNDRPVNARAALEQLLILKNTDGAEQNFTTSQPQGGAEKTTFNFGEHPQHIAAMEPTQGIAHGGVTHGGATTAVQITAPGANATNPHTQAQQTLNQIHTNAITQQVHTSANAATAAQTAQAASEITAAQITTATDEKSSLISKINNLSQAAKISTALILAVVTIATLAIVISQSGARKEAKAYESAITKASTLEKQNKLQDGLLLTKAELNALLNSAASTENNSQRNLLRKGLAYAQGADYEAGPIIAQFIIESPAIETHTRIELIKQTMANRNESSNIEALLNFAKTAPDTDSATAAIDAARANIDPENADKHIISFLDIMNSSDKLPVVNSAERAASDIISKSKNKEAFSKTVSNSYNSAIDKNVKHAMLRLLGTMNTPETREIIIKALQSDDSALSSAAISAIEKQEDDSLLDSLFSYLSVTNNHQLRTNAFKAALKTISSKRPRKEGWQQSKTEKLASLSLNNNEKMQLISLLASKPEPWAKELIKNYTKSHIPSISRRAKRAQATKK